MKTPKDSGPDDSGANLVVFLAFIAALFGLFFPGGFSDRLLVVSVPLAVIGAGLKIAAAVRHTGRGSAQSAPDV